MKRTTILDCFFCQANDPSGLVFDENTDRFVHLCCINEALRDPTDEVAQNMAYLLEPVNEEDYDA